MKKIQIKRIYDDVSAMDEKHNNTYRILVDRLWPRGISKEIARLDEWNKDIAPSTELREWFGHKEERFEEFTKRYKNELSKHDDELKRISNITKQKNLLLLYGAKNENYNQAIVLQQALKELQSY